MFTFFLKLLFFKKHSKESEDKLFNCLSYIRLHDYNTKGLSFHLTLQYTQQVRTRSYNLNTGI